MKKNGDIVTFLRQKDYIMENNNLGEGSFGKTVLLSDPQLGGEKFVAKKYAPVKITDKEKFFKNFCDEIKIMLRLNHRNIVRIYNWLLLEDQYTGFIVMEYIEGKNIERYIKDYNPNYSHVSLNDMFLQLLDAFAYIEQNKVIHRDIRAGNILITKDGIIKIIDFGLGKVIDSVDKPERDTLATKINRDSLDITPQELYEGIYNSQTDMFYLAELVCRLLHDSQKEQFFSYSHILNKMKNCNPKDRFKSFSEIKEMISKRDFAKLTEIDRNIYKKFADSLFAAILNFTQEPEFETDISTIINNLADIISKNCFEDDIQHVENLISVFVVSGFRYNEYYVSTDGVKNFYEWFCSLDLRMQKLVLDNLSYKLTQKEVKKNPMDDIPF